MEAALIIAWRLGLGWLVGRRFVLLTTSTQESERLSVLPYAFAGGTFYVPADPGAPWVGDVAAKPQALVQAAPGPRGVRARPVTRPDELTAARQALGVSGDVMALDGSGDPSPMMTPPDLAWVWPVAAVVWWLTRD
ncbi:MAG: hypothetical protein KJP12_05760 [Acidimicrobiia bacterium]|nr:hypothetical protein [Acidimicrobiia bacterium]MBT8214712.1 hypothetical protein [Acidimicrobiia bacterium]